jgi:hypothetical protein
LDSYRVGKHKKKRFEESFWTIVDSLADSAANLLWSFVDCVSGTWKTWCELVEHESSGTGCDPFPILLPLEHICRRFT